ncbi:uncharacterized protein V3H82_022309 [Fundulus diaphanus]
MCDCFHLAFPNWHAASSGTAGRRLRAPEPTTEDDSICEEPTQLAEGERPRPQGSSPVQEYPEAAKYADGDEKCEEHDPDHKPGSGHKSKKSGLGSIFDRTSTPKMSKLKEAHTPEDGVIVNTAKDGCAEGLVYGGGGKEGIFIKKVVPESPASKSLKVKEGDQILSATVYFDNMSYEDAIQILEHAQAYKLKLCLKRQPDIPETEPTIESDVIPEEDICSAEMREKGKTRRRGDARISWPKFPSLGKRRKSRFTRSHSSSEADEQRKLELSPTTSDTESPVKSQDALKGKKKHKIKLSGLTKRGRISSSEDQDTDAPSTGQISGDIQQKQESDTLSPEFPEYPSGETPEINIQAVKEAGDVVESDQKSQTTSDTQNMQHKVEFVSIDSTLKTTDLTVPLTDHESQSGAPKSPDEKKKKKELKMKILGKDKMHKKEAKAKSSPKRLKTLGASVDAEDLPETGKSDVISTSESKTKLLGDQTTVAVNNKKQSSESLKVTPSKSMTSQICLPKVELDISVRKSTKKGDERTHKGKDMKQKQSKMSSPKHKQPEIDISNLATSEETQKVNDQESPTRTGRVSTTQLPKREDIEIPGMEDMSRKSTTKITEPKADLKNKENHSETVQMSIDVNSVKEAVSKLPGFKLPQVDISGAPIPEEITVIDANAQRISVKTPTKMVQPRPEEHFTRSDTTASSEISKRMFVTENTIDFKKSEKEEKTMPSFGMSAKYRRLPYIGIDLQKQTFIQEKETKSETKKEERQTGEVICKVKMPELDNIDFIDSTDELSIKKDCGLTSIDISTDVKKTSAISFRNKENDDEPEDARNKLSKVGITPSDIFSGNKEIISDKGTTKAADRDEKSTFKWPDFDISVPQLKGTTVDISTSKKDTEAEGKGGLIPGRTERAIILKSADVNVPEEIEAEKTQMEIKPVESQGEFVREASPFAKFGIKMPKIKGPEFDLSLSKKDAHDKESHDKAEGPLPGIHGIEVTPGKGNVSFLKQKMELEKSGVEVKHLQPKDEHVQGAKIKMPKLGMTTTKFKGPEININLSKKDTEVSLPEAKPEVQLTEDSETDFNKDTKPKTEIKKSDLKIIPLQNEGETNGHGHKIKMPQLGIALPKVTTHESDLRLSKKGTDLTLTEVKQEIKDHEVESNGSSTKQDFRAPGIKASTKDVEGSSSKFKMFKMPRFGAATPNLSSEVLDKPSPEDEVAIDTIIPDTDVGPSPDVKTKVSEIDGRTSGFKIPKFGISLPKLKGPEIDTTISKKGTDVDVTLIKGEAEVKLLDAESTEPGIRQEAKTPQTGVQQDSTSKPEITIPISEATVEVKLSHVDKEKMNFPAPVALTETPELEIQTLKAESQIHGQEGNIKLPKIGIKMPKVKGPGGHLGLSSEAVDVRAAEDKVDLQSTELMLPDTETKVEIPVPTADVSLGKAEILIPTGKVEVGKPEVQTQPSLEGQGGRIKMPKLGITMPKGKGAETKEDVERILTESKTDVIIPEADFEEQDVEQLPSKFNMPAFKFPKLGLGTPSSTTGVYSLDKKAQRDDMDMDFHDEVLAVTIVAPNNDTEEPSIDVKTIGADYEGKTKKFKMPSLGFSVSQIKGHDTDGCVTQQQTKAEDKLGDPKQKSASTEEDAKVPDIDIIAKDKQRSQGKFKMPTFKLPKFGVGISATDEENYTMGKDVTVKGANIEIPQAIVTIDSGAPSSKFEGKSKDVKMTEIEYEGKESKSEIPSLGIDDLNTRSTEVEATATEVKVLKKEKEGSPSRFKMPTFKLPKFGLSAQSSTEEEPPLDKDVKTGGGETMTFGEILAVSTEGQSANLKMTGSENEGKGKKIKLPSLGFSVPQTKGSDSKMSLSTTDVDVTVPDVKSEVKVLNENFNKSAEVEVKVPVLKGTSTEKEGSPSKFKMPTFKLPKFGLSTQSSTEEMPHLNEDFKRASGETTTSVEIHAASTEVPSIDIKDPSADLKTTGSETEGKGRKFKLPSLDFSVSQTKRPDPHISLPTTDVDATVPDVKMEVKLPEEKFSTSSKVEAKAPEFKGTKTETEGSPSKFKMPTFKLPKFGLSAQSSTEEAPPLNKDLKTAEGETTESEKVIAVGIEGPSIDIKDPSADVKVKITENEGRGRKFKLPSLDFSVSQTKRPDPHASLPTTDVDVTVPDVKMEVKLPEEKFSTSSKVEAKAPEFKGTRTETEGSPSKFKMPTFKLPKFGLSAQSSTEEAPPLNKDLKTAEGETTESEKVIAVGSEGPSIEISGPSVESKTEGSEREGKGKKFKLPSLGFSGTQAKGLDTDLSLRKDVNITQPELRAEVKFPDDELKLSNETETKGPEIQVVTKDIDGSSSKFKMPSFKFPKFGFSTQSSTEEAPSFDKDVKMEGGESKASEGVLKVSAEEPSIEIKDTSVDLNTVGSKHEGRGGKFKLPSLSFSVPQAKEHDGDLSIKTNLDITIPEVKAEVELSGDQLNKSSVAVETKALESKDTRKDTEGSPSKFKMPNFKLPKFGLAPQTSAGEVHLLDQSATSQGVIAVTTEEPSIEIKGPSLEPKTEKSDREGKGKKFKMPSLGFSAEAKGPDDDLWLSKKEVNVTLPEVKDELLDDHDLKKMSMAIENKGPEIQTVTKEADGSPSKFKMSGFKLPKFGLSTQSSTGESPQLDKPKEDGEQKYTVTAMETKAPEIKVVSKDIDGSPSKFRMPTFKLPKFGLATQSSDKQVPASEKDVETLTGESTTLEEVLKVSTEGPTIEIKGPAVDLTSSGTDKEKRESKFKLPSLGFSVAQAKGSDIDIDISKTDVDFRVPEVNTDVLLSDPKTKQPLVEMEVKSSEIKAHSEGVEAVSAGKIPKITLPKFGAVSPHLSVEIPNVKKEKRIDVERNADIGQVDVNAKEGEQKKYEGKVKVQLSSAEAKVEDVPTVESEGKVKRLNWTFPNISFSRTGGKAPVVDVNVETPKADVTSAETKICQSDVDVKEPSRVPAVEAPSAAELDTNLKKSKFSLPKISFSKSNMKELEVKAELPDHGVKTEKVETEVIAEVKPPADEHDSTAPETTASGAEVKSKDGKGSPLKFKMPTLKMPRFGSVSHEVTTETHTTEKIVEGDECQLAHDPTGIIKGPTTDVKTDASKSIQPDHETPNTESDTVVHGSPSKFKLPTFKIPRLSLSRSKPEDESNTEHENTDDRPEIKIELKEENKSPKLTLTSFGDIVELTDVDLDVQKGEKAEQSLETSKELHEPVEPTAKHTEAKDKVEKSKQDATKNLESSGWFKFPKFGLSSPTEQPKIPDKAEQIKDSSPVGEMKDEEGSSTCSVQSSDAFADISSTITSEPVGPFLPSPAKVTVKYSDDSAAAGVGEAHGEIMTSITRTELTADVPNLPEKITILSSGVSSSSEDTVRLKSGKIHIITSKIQATPESQHAMIPSAVQVQSSEGLALQVDDTPSWTIQDAQSATRTVFEKHLIQETSTERSESKETLVITKQITLISGTTDPISGETASSIQRLKDSVHSEKMRFFDEAEK